VQFQLLAMVVDGVTVPDQGFNVFGAVRPDSCQVLAPAHATQWCEV
jgi:hypothetical protein